MRGGIYGKHAEGRIVKDWEICERAHSISILSVPSIHKFCCVIRCRSMVHPSGRCVWVLQYCGFSELLETSAETELWAAAVRLCSAGLLQTLNHKVKTSQMCENWCFVAVSMIKVSWNVSLLPAASSGMWRCIVWYICASFWRNPLPLP